MQGERKLVGVITHYYPKINVAVVDVKDEIKIGDKIAIEGNVTSFEQEVTSMQIEHKQIEKAEPGQSIGLKVNERVREKDSIFKIS